MPVVDESGRMLGIVTFDDAMDVIEDDAEEVKTHWAWGQLAISVAIFLVLLVPYTFLILHFFGSN
ncbi:mgtE intracellular N-terminal domain protein [Cryptobacterium sp. CAG:338]|nr:mgtE intracellular N-terminal domain protein [Cryptobacterium sp. CAG:338]